MKNTKVLALRIIAYTMLIMGIIGTARGSTAATPCLCGACSLVVASNRLVRYQK